MTRNKRVGIIAAMQVEIDGIKERISDAKCENLSGMEFVRGHVDDVEVIAVKCGVGKVFAAIAAQTMILEYTPDCIINTGVAGGLADGLKILDVVVADSVLQHDMDTSPMGDPVGMISGINIVNIPVDAHVRQCLCAGATAAGANVTVGTVATGDCFVSDSAKKDHIKKTFGAAACEMEGAAIGQVCYVNGVPFGVLRAISDGGNDEAIMDFPAFAAAAAEISIRSVLEFLKII